MKTREITYGGLVLMLAGATALRVYFPRLTNEQNQIEAVVKSIQEERKHLDETVWEKEVLAQKYEQTIVKYWDRMLRPEDDKYAVLAAFPFETITLGKPLETVKLDWGVKRTKFGGVWKTFDRKGGGNF